MNITTNERTHLEITQVRAYRDTEYFHGSRAGHFPKRVIDFSLSLLMLLLMIWWLFPLIALLIKLDSRGPVFFIQRRIGRCDGMFSCIKFRTMVPNNQAHTKQALPDDQRVTRFGKFLRRTNWDELPQLFNVLAGSMSLVGPRPHMPFDCERFSFFIQHYEHRHYIKPGITGLAQVKGFHGAIFSERDIMMRFHWDMEYIRRRTMLLDFQILFRTVMQRIPFF